MTVHELAIGEAIAAKVQTRAAGRDVIRVVVRIGYFRQVVPDALMFSWEILTAGTDLAECELEIEHIAAVVSCRDCDATTTLDQPALVCRSCQGHNVDLIAGDELIVVSLELSEA